MKTRTAEDVRSIPTPDELKLYTICVDAFKEYFPNEFLDLNWIRTCFDENRNPNMREYEDINFNF